MSAMKLTEQDKKRRRRAFAGEELQKLFLAAWNSVTVFRGLTGEDRAMLYLVAASTGLRVAELASLAPASFDLTAATPTVRCLAAYTKNGEEAVLPLRSDLADRLAPWLLKKPDGRPVWPGTWSKKASARMLRIDLAAGEIDYEDGSGRYAGFHSLRHRFLSNLARAGVHPKAAQALARHSTIDLTMNVYTHAVLGDLATAVESLPALPVAEAEALAATGTDGLVGDDAKRRSKRRSESGSDRQDRASRVKAWQDRPARSSTREASRKPLGLEEIDKACQPLASPISERGRRDSNPQHPDRQSGTLTN